MNKSNWKTSPEEALQQAKSLIARMTSTEKIAILGGVHGFSLASCDRLGIPLVNMSDASTGINLRDILFADSQDASKRFDDTVLQTFLEQLGEPLPPVLEKSVAFPCFMTLAASWNCELAHGFAKSIGQECRAGGVHILLGPGMNIYRHAQCGRNFEYLGEDPYLVSEIIRNYVTGLQSEGVGATLKHFIANNTDFRRRRSNSVLSDRALREIYMPAFQAGIDAGAVAVMTSYNQVNGEWAGQNKHIITDILRGEMGFEFLVMTDWWSIYDGEKTVKSGQDIEMPKANALAEIPTLLEAGKISMDDIDRMLTNIVKTCILMNFYDPKYKKPEYLNTFDSHVDVALNSAREGIVLLKNDGLLPIAPSQTILFTGKFAEEIPRGGGASEVSGFDNLSLLSALQDEFGEGLTYKSSPTDAEISSADIVLLSSGTLDSEAWDRSFYLPKEEEDQIKRITALNPKTVLLLNTGSGICMTGWHSQAAAIVYCWYPGQIGNKAVAEILSGKVNPSGKLPFTIEKSFADSPGYGYLPKGEELYEGWQYEIDHDYPVFDVHYKEDIFVGYRWYEHKKIAPLFPFGHGLSYTSFEYSGLSLSANSLSLADLQKGAELTVGLKVSNTGKMAGKEIVQVYISDTKCSVPRPPKELKGFAKLALAPGETKSISIRLSEKAFRFWHPETRNWTVEPGEFIILFARSSAEIIYSQTFEVTV